MDTSETYIKMCDCEEIQGQWRPKVGDYIVGLNELTLEPEAIGILNLRGSPKGWYVAANIKNQAKGFMVFVDKHDSTCKWLPRQDQLLILSGLTWHDFDILCWSIVSEKLEVGIIDYPTKEVAGLMAVMYFKHHKVWTGTEWIKEGNE